MKINLKFEPAQKVKITAYGLDYEGRILRCYVGINEIVFYETEYACNGKLERGDFFEDGLQAI